jgi:VanZ family protein
MVFSLFYIGSKPVAVGLFHPPWDKVAHGVTFSAIAILFWFSANGRRPVLVALVVIAIGGLDELHQIILPGRSADWADFLVDFLAAAGAIGLLSLLIRVPWVADD